MTKNTQISSVARNIISRRMVLTSLGGVGAAAVLQSAQAQEEGLYPLQGDDGKPIANYKLPSELSPFSLPGLISHGSQSPDVILIEFFDYNCPFCRKAVGDLDALVSKDKNLRLVLANNAILNPGSYLAARVQQAVLKLYGPDRTYEFHKKLFAHRGMNDSLSALSVAKSMGLDTSAIEDRANSDIVGAVVKRHVELAANLGFEATPSFALGSFGILGYPGPKSIGTMISASRKCDRPICR